MSLAFLSAALSLSTIEVIVISVIFVACLFFILGFVSGCFGHKYKQSVLESCTTEASPSSPLTGEVHVSNSKEQDSQNLEMLENIAYGQLPLAN